eukprot:CAMPEP_0170511548 /NCGR_PEP_ID=MMETSP0208-20121228/66366_1 /TAXON_ID=197538 /ORGANISM="Strombidium inclinatum, Strain S3" /LENGTH=122 /DNA_ID=CAMNT_0010795099 /DNA_START=435 /DNA_END=800 /DNA_ORIENTATION=+
MEHKWFAFIRMKNKNQRHLLTKFVEFCTFSLHPYDSPPYKIRPPRPGKSIFERGFDYGGLKNIRADECGIGRNCWGSFLIPITIHFQPITGRKEKVECEHYLHYEGKGKWSTLRVSFPQQRV